MKRIGDRNVEEMLRSAELKPAPPGLRERILEAAAKQKEESAWTTPLLRWSVAGCAAILAVVFITDAGLGRRQQDRLQALLDGSRWMQSQANDESRLLAEVLGEAVGRKLFAQNGRIAAEERGAGQARREEVLKELLEEDFDGSKGPKDIY